MGAIQQLLLAAAGKKSLTFVASAVSGASTVTWPAGLSAGDVAFLIDESQGGTAPAASVTPSGFTLLDSTATALNAVTIVRVNVSGKVLSGSESGSLTGMVSGTGTSPGVAKTLLVFRPSTAVASFSFGGKTIALTTGTPANQTCAASAAAAPVIAIGFYLNLSTGGTITTRGFSPAEDAEITNGSAPGISYVKYKIMNTSPADATISMNDNGSANYLQSFYLTVT